MQGIYIGFNRPKSKKQVREQAAADATKVTIEATSLFGNEFEGPATELPEGTKVYFVGPDPYTKRNFYGTIERRGGKVVVK